jgi:hypothetical protein
LVHEVLNSPGHPLDAGARSFLEPRFGRDFGDVRVHTDARAAASARAVNALAYTVGQHVVFGAGQYQPAAEDGRKLLAHELAHVTQQAGGWHARLMIGPAHDPLEQEADRIAEHVLSPAAGEGPRVSRIGPRVQRAVSAQMDKIRSNLTTGLFDWFVTDAEDHEVLLILKALNDTDLADTVAQMEREDLVDTFFGNVSDDDELKESVTLERINQFRVRTVTRKSGSSEVTTELVGPCTFEDHDTAGRTLLATQSRARQTREALERYLGDPAANASTAALLDRHFFHQANTRTLTPAEQLGFARDIRANYAAVEAMTPLPNFNCATKFDSLCRALAAAYVTPGSNPPRVTLCRSFFEDEDEATQTLVLFHELFHAYANVPGVPGARPADRAYFNERIYAYLPPERSMDNADSYALFALDVLGVKGGAALYGRKSEDSISHCTDGQPDTLRRDFAFAARMVTNALNVIGDPNLGAAQLTTHFKTTDRVKLKRVIERFQKLDEAFKGNVNFECESDCDAGEFGYWRAWGWTVHVCLPYFGLRPDETRIDEILLLAVMERLGLHLTARHTSSAYASQTEDQAYDNPDAYVAYAREITQIWFP